jgi:glycosyltransferase involved in cell wall biosynthesis
LLDAPCEQALRLNESCEDPLVYHMIMLHRVRRRAAEFDFIHFHTDYLHFPLFAEGWDKTLTTPHGRLDLPDLPAVMREFSMMPLVSISDAQRAPLSWANWYETVLHGLPRDLYRLGSGAGGYLAFLGRIAPEKRPDRAIAIARQAGVPLRIAAKVDPVDRDYFSREIAPLLHDPLVEFIGEIGDAEKSWFLGNAAALLFPIDWPEPFGLVLIEALATGTPVIAFSRLGAGDHRGWSHRHRRDIARPWTRCRWRAAQPRRDRDASRNASQPIAWRAIICRSIGAYCETAFRRMSPSC